MVPGGRDGGGPPGEQHPRAPQPRSGPSRPHWRRRAPTEEEGPPFPPSPPHILTELSFLMRTRVPPLAARGIQQIGRTQPQRPEGTPYRIRTQDVTNPANPCHLTASRRGGGAGHCWDRRPCWWPRPRCGGRGLGDRAAAAGGAGGQPAADAPHRRPWPRPHRLTPSRSVPALPIPTPSTPAALWPPAVGGGVAVAADSVCIVAAGAGLCRAL